MKIKYKPKQSTNNSTKRIIRDSNPKTVVGTLVGLMATHVSVFVLALVSMFALTFITDSNNVNNTYAVSYEYSIKYNDNVVDNMPMDVNDGRAVGGEFSLSGNTPARSGYKFLGWCNALPTTADGTDSCSGTTYQPSAGIAIASAANFHFYAMWKEANTFNKAFAAAGKTQLDGYYKMQDASGSICTAVDEGETGTLIDTRDKQTYTVAKLADGKCWMTENLNIAGGTALSSNDTDFDPTYALPTTNGWTVDDGKLILPASSAAFGYTYNVAKLYNSGNKTNNCNSSRGTYQPCYSYYSWDAATLGSGRTIGTDDTDAPYSICPKNWRLPTSGNKTNDSWKRGDFYTLAIAYGADLENSYYDAASSTGANFYKNAGPDTIPNFLLAGYYSNTSPQLMGSSGSYWSATSALPYSNQAMWYAHDLYFNSTHVNVSGSSDRYLGLSVRCVFAE